MNDCHHLNIKPKRFMENFNRISSVIIKEVGVISLLKLQKRSHLVELRSYFSKQKF